ncbi:DASH complex subunit SPC34 [Nakaseomyces bracarensis]|uniref:DASH complex subunit SPC34 n=1 Tax=Nakaseomyces bracarensis TaxID=273131 RepID=A0ABR4NM64_9SACH
MGESMNTCLDEIKGSLESISSLYFKPPGIFHNAMIRISDDSQSSNSLNDKIKNLIKGCDPKEESTLFQLEKKNHTLRRKDGRQALFQYLEQRDRNLKRNRRLGYPEKVPVIHVPNEFYIREHNEELLLDAQRSKRLKTMRGSLLNNNDTMNSNTNTLLADLSHKNIGLMATLSRKFEGNEDIKHLLTALQNGSVILDDLPQTDKKNRRKTLFVEDFSMKTILTLLDEVLEMCPTDDYRKGSIEFHDVAKELEEEAERLQDEIQKQNEELVSRSKPSSANSSSSGVQKLIEKERQKIEFLESQLSNLH